LADFKADSSSTRWYNILSFHFLQIESEEVEEGSGCGRAEGCHKTSEVTDKAVLTQHSKQESEISIACTSSSSGRQTNLKEESSDESTIISSQTSTLTRNHGKGLSRFFASYFVDGRNKYVLSKSVAICRRY